MRRSVWTVRIAIVVIALAGWEALSASGLLFRDVEDKGKGPKDPTATLTHKAFPGGVLSLIGANSGAGFRRVSRRI